jgi:hypothetical protein
MDTKIKKVDSRSRHPLLKFQTKYCDDVIKHCQNGFTFNSFAAVIGISVTTLNKWADTYEKFSEAKEIATQFLSMEYQKDLKGNSSGEIKGNASATQFALKNIDPDNFKDRIEHTIEDTRPIIIDTGFVRQVLNQDGVEVDFREIRKEEIGVDDL